MLQEHYVTLCVCCCSFSPNFTLSIIVFIDLFNLLCICNNDILYYVTLPVEVVGVIRLLAKEFANYGLLILIGVPLQNRV